MRKKNLIWSGVFLATGLLSLGFDLSNSAVPVEEIQEGGVPVDGIPDLQNPERVSAVEADEFLEAEDWVVGLVLNQTARAYPFRILNWHLIVNDSFTGKPVVVTYCPLTGTIRAFRGEAGGVPLTLGVSGKLYKNNLIFYDRESKSLWSQMRGEAITGPRKGTTLESLPVWIAQWKRWRTQYPATEVLSLNTGYLRDYERNPYEKYERSMEALFPVSKIRPELPPRERVVGIFSKGRAKAYPWSFLMKLSRDRLEDSIGGEKIWLERVSDLESIQVRDQEGNLLPVIFTSWFAWQDFYPATEVYLATHA